MKNFLYGLALAFIVLKIIGYITWSWWLVLLPIYGGLAIFLPFYIIYKLFQRSRARKKSIDQFEGDRKSRSQQRLDAYMKEQQNNKLR